VKVHVGYELGTGKSVDIPLRNLAVTGQTQESGKTTTLEALATRSGATVLTFVTKRGEGSFTGARKVQPYFRDRADWQFVDSLLEAQLKEKNKFLRPWIMKICRTTRTLADVHREVRSALKKAKGINEGVYTQLEAYLDLIVPDIQSADLAETLDLRKGINVMDVSAFSTAMQMLFVQSAIDDVNAHYENTIIVIPEAWEFIPEGKGSPVKESAIRLVRKGSGIGNRIWVDSQDMAGVDKTILRGCPVWLIGVQREANEIKRNLANIPAGIAKPKPADVAKLGIGQFFVCFGDRIVKTYVQPAWMSGEDAADLATGKKVGFVPPPKGKRQTVEITGVSMESGMNRLVEMNTALKLELDEARQELGKQRGRVGTMRKALADLREPLASMLAALDRALDQGKAGALDQGAAEGVGFAPQPAADYVPPAAATSQQLASLEPTKAQLPLLQVLVKAHPLPLTAELWGLFAGKAPGSGWWNATVKQLRDGLLVHYQDGQFQATATGARASGIEPAGPKTDAELFGLFRDQVRETLGNGPIVLLDALAPHHKYRLSVEQWALLAGKAPGSGWWNASVKPLRDLALIETNNRGTVVTDRGFAILGGKPDLASTGPMLLEARRMALSASAFRLNDGLDRAMTRKQLAEKVGLQLGSGYWNGAIKELLDSGLAFDSDDLIHPRQQEELAL
jgi:hypothetical protein